MNTVNIDGKASTRFDYNNEGKTKKIEKKVIDDDHEWCVNLENKLN